MSRHRYIFIVMAALLAFAIHVSSAFADGDAEKAGQGKNSGVKQSQKKKVKQEEEAAKKAEEAAKAKAAEEAAKVKADEDAKKLSEESQKLAAAEKERADLELAQKLLAQEQEKAKQEEEAAKKAEEAAKAKAAEEAKKFVPSKELLDSYASLKQRVADFEEQLKSSPVTTQETIKLIIKDAEDEISKLEQDIVAARQKVADAHKQQADRIVAPLRKDCADAKEALKALEPEELDKLLPPGRYHK